MFLMILIKITYTLSNLTFQPLLTLHTNQRAKYKHNELYTNHAHNLICLKAKIILQYVKRDLHLPIGMRTARIQKFLETNVANTCSWIFNTKSNVGKNCKTKLFKHQACCRIRGQL